MWTTSFQTLFTCRYRTYVCKPQKGRPSLVGTVHMYVNQVDRPLPAGTVGMYVNHKKAAHHWLVPYVCMWTKWTDLYLPVLYKCMWTTRRQPTTGWYRMYVCEPSGQIFTCRYRTNLCEPQEGSPPLVGTVRMYVNQVYRSLPVSTVCMYVNHKKTGHLWMVPYVCMWTKCTDHYLTVP